MPVTYTGQHKAIVKEAEGGIPFICFELLDGEEIPDFKNANIGIFLDNDTTYEQAQEIADSINSKLKGLYLTKFS